MNALAIAKALWPKLRGFLLKIGQWLMQFLWSRGRTKLIGYMEGRVDVFLRRIRRLKRRNNPPAWRIRWLNSRVMRWRAAIRWLASKAADAIKEKVGDALLGWAKAEIPEEVPDEVYGRWVRRVKAA